MTTTDLILALGGSTSAIAILVFFLWRLTYAKINLNWERNNQKQIELLKSELSRQNKFNDSILTSHNHGHQQAQDKRINTIECLWESILQRETFSVGIATNYRIYTTDEIKLNFLKIDQKDNTINLNNITMKDFIEKTFEKEFEVDKRRPFMSSYLWQLYKVHGVFIGRSIHLFVESKHERKSPLWSEDEAMLKTLSTVLSSEEISSASNQEIGSYNQIVTLIESKILNECHKILSGDLAMEASAEQARKLLEISKLTD